MSKRFIIAGLIAFAVAVTGMVVAISQVNANRIVFSINSATINVESGAVLGFDELGISSSRSDILSHVSLESSDSDKAVINSASKSISFMGTGEVTINIFPNNAPAERKALHAIIFPTGIGAMFEHENVVLFLNGASVSSNQVLISDSELVSLGAPVFDENIVDYNAQTGELRALALGNTNIEITVSTPVKNYTISFSVAVKNLNYATAISFENSSYIIKVNATSAAFVPNITYVETLGGNKVAPILEIVENSDVARVAGNKITGLKPGTATLRATVQNSHTTTIFCEATIIVEPSMELSVALLDASSGSVSIPKSNKKADGSYELYYLEVLSNIAVDENAIDILFEKAGAASGQAVCLAEEEEVYISGDGKTIRLPVYFLGAGGLNVCVGVLDSANNYGESVYSNVLELEVVPFLAALDYDVLGYATNGQLSALVPSDDIYTIYLACGDSAQIGLAHTHGYNNTIVIQSDLDINIEEITTTGAECLSIAGQTIMANATGTTRLKLSATDGSGVSSNIYIEVLEIVSVVSGMNVNSLTLFYDELSSCEFDVVAQVVPVYASYIPSVSLAFKYNIDEELGNLTLSGNKIIALNKTISPITIVATCMWQTYEVVVTSKSIVPEFVVSGYSTGMVDGEIVFAISSEETFTIACENYPAFVIETISYSFFDSGADEFLATSEIVDLEKLGLYMFTLFADSVGATILRILINNIYAINIAISVAV